MVEKTTTTADGQERGIQTFKERKKHSEVQIIN